MNKIKLKWWRWKLLCSLIIMLFSAPAFAALNLSLGDIKDNANSAISSADLKDTSKGLIDARWSSFSGSNPAISTGKLKLAKDVAEFNSNPASADPETGFYGYVAGDGYYFWRGPNETDPGANVYIRVWKASPNQKGSYYSAISIFANGAGAAASGNLSATTNYKADAPDKPVITKIEESAVTSYPGAAKSSSLVVSSAQPAATDGIREVTSYLWSITPAPSGTVVNTANTLTLAASQLAPNTAYTFKVKHSNWFGGNDNWSNPVTYSIGAGGVGITTNEVTRTIVVTNEVVRTVTKEITVEVTRLVTLESSKAFGFKFNMYPVAQGKIIVNSIAIPSAKLTKPVSMTVSRAADLANAINQGAKDKVVRAIYTFDAANNTAIGAIFDSNGNFLSGTNFNITPGIGYQVYLSKEVRDLVFEGK